MGEQRIERGGSGYPAVLADCLGEAAPRDIPGVPVPVRFAGRKISARRASAQLIAVRKLKACAGHNIPQAGKRHRGQ